MSAPLPLILRWRVPERRIALRWRGPAGMARSLARDPAAAIAAIVGPPGPPGSGGAPLRLDASLAATWTLAHPFGRVPTVQVFLADGEAVLADIQADAAQIVVAFAAPRQGFVLAF